MDSVIFQDSPLAFYLEGEGKGEHEWATTTPGKEPASLEPVSFAPTGLPKAYSKFRRKLPRALNLSLEVPSARGLVGSLQNNCSRALNSRLGRPDNTHFLEQFRYTIVASQLLSDHAHTNSYKPSIDPSLADTETEKQSREAERVALSWQGVSSTGGLAFVLVWSLHWARGAANALSGTLRIALVMLIFATAVALSYAFVRRHWLHYLRHQAVDGASQFVSTAQAYDGAATATITLIQEVELVSRGYRISSPLPPITRLEEKSQTRRCSKLRHVLQSAVVSLVGPYRQACEDLKPLANEFDLEKYYDIYEISRADLQEAKDPLAGLDLEDGESLKALRFALHQVHILKKIVLCSLLALHADGGKLDFSKWATAVDVMQQLSSLTADATSRVDMVLNEEERFSMPPTPKAPLTPGKESMRGQIKKLGSLSQGIRGLQAKMHILREESNKTLELSDDNSDLRMNLLVQYDSIGTDLKALVDEWENGRAALAMNIEKNERRISLSSAGFLSPRSPPTSLGGITAIESSPIDALRMFSADERSRSSAEPSSSDDEIFEAVALPRQKNTLTRDERIAKMKEDRIRHAVVREKAEANTHMLKELETVIKLRPRGRTTGRMTNIESTMLEARLEQANLLKKVVEAIKDLVQDCNFDCNDSGIALQAMDNSHVALVSMMLKAESFSPFRCDRNIALGINLTSLTKVLRCAQNEDILTLKAEDAPDVVNLVFETSESDRLSEYDIKLMDIDQEHLGIPETEYAATITMPSAEFQRICRDLMALSESVAIEATKEGVKFACTGDIGSGAVTLRSHSNVENTDLNVEIDLSEPVALTFSLKYLVNFCKASGLSKQVKLCLSNEVPLLVEYSLASNSYLRFYLAPKIGDEE